jgi:hypothetical protein
MTDKKGRQMSGSFNLIHGREIDASLALHGASLWRLAYTRRAPVAQTRTLLMLTLGLRLANPEPMLRTKYLPHSRAALRTQTYASVSRPGT